MTQTQQGFALAPNEGEALWFLGSLLTIKATNQQTGSWALMETLMPPNSGPPPHVHHDEDEAWYVLEGQIAFFCGDQTIQAAAGSFVFAPRGVKHGFQVGSQAARTLTFASPRGQFENFVRAMAEPAPSPTLPPPSEPDLAKLIELAARNRIEILGPPPGP